MRSRTGDQREGISGEDRLFRVKLASQEELMKEEVEGEHNREREVFHRSRQ